MLVNFKRVKMDEGRYACVRLFSGLDKPLTYSVPARFAGVVRAGCIVRVPLRGGVGAGVITRLSSSPEEAGKFKIRPILELVQNLRALTPDLLDLAFWIKDYYASSMQSVFESMIPAVVRSGRGELALKEIHMPVRPDLGVLESLRRRAPRQYEIVSFFLANSSPVLKSELCDKFSLSAVDSLVDKGVLKETSRRVKRTAYDDELSSAETIPSSGHVLNDEQSAAFSDISKLLDSKKYATHLLYGVTGSGKTEIYIHAMRKVLSEGGSCIFLVPEIALTPQTVGRLRSRLGDCGAGLVVWHSGLSDGQRLDAWRDLADGSARVVVGARSCIFAPLSNLRLIVVDEEHDTAYKQDKAPRYNARDVAVVRARLCGALCLLGSATPSLETLYNTKRKKYSVSRISKRIDGCVLPTVMIADMRREKGGAVLSRLLLDKLADRLDKGQQSILFLNRRGYAKVYECPDCGYVAECPHCSVSMTWHRGRGIVKCHICGYEARAPMLCPKCGSERAKWRGYGTQKIENLIADAFPSARVGRMDADAMRRRDDYRRVLGDFRRGKLDILIGTQMIAKGLDFPRVTLVGLVDADISLHMPSFRAAERTYQLIVQVAGRAGRGDGAGEVVIQTRTPEAIPIQYAKRDDMESFLEEELQNRKEFAYPPFRRIVRQLFKSRNPDKLSYYAEEFAKAAEKRLGNICEIRGPSPAPIEKIEDFYHWQLWYFCGNVSAVVSELVKLRAEFPLDEDVSDVLDSDPVD